MQSSTDPDSNTFPSTPRSEDVHENLVIRAQEPEDYAAVQQIYAQPNAYRNTLQLPFASAHSWKERTAKQHQTAKVLVACVDGVPVGNIGLVLDSNLRRRHVASIGMGVHDAYAGRGIGQALLAAVIDIADNWWQVQRLELTVFEDNMPAIRLYQRNGFIEEGRHKNYAFRDGQMVDTIAMARCR